MSDAPGTPVVNLWYTRPDLVGEVHVAAPAFRFSDMTVHALEDTGWRELAFYDGGEHCWYDRSTGKPLGSMSIRRDDFAPLYLAMRKGGQVLTELVHHGGLWLPGRTKMSQLPAVRGLSAEEWPVHDEDDGKLLAVFMVFEWDTGNDHWPTRASGELFVRGLGDWEIREPLWDGSVGWRVRPSELSERVRMERAWS